MLAAFIIVAREVLEAAIVVGVVLAATKGLAGRTRWIAGGVGAGVAGAGLVAALAGTIAAALAGTGQEVFNASVLGAAAVMLGWHNVWMASHGRELAAKAAATGEAVLMGERPLYAIAAVVGLATLREGAEVVLFLYGIVIGAGAALVETLLGGLLGLAAGAALGAALYQGLLRVPTRWLFTVTSWLIMLLASGMASQGAGYLVQAGWVPALGRRIWDTSSLLPEQGFPGQLLHTLIGYSDRPNGMQLLVYVATVVLIAAAMRQWGSPGGGIERETAPGRA